MQRNKKKITDLIAPFREKGAVILLESQMLSHPASTKNYLAAEPKSWIKTWGDKIEIKEGNARKSFTGNPWKAFMQFREKHNDWLFGYLGYDLKNFVEDLESANPALMNAPDLFFMVPGFLIETDIFENITVLKGEKPGYFKERVHGPEISMKLQQQISEAEYLNLVEKAKKDIYEGEYYEINLSHPLEFQFDGDSLDLYLAMKEVGAVPFGGYVHFDKISICCSSPERFLAKKGSRVWSQPIKGTASRQKNANPDLDIERLRQSEKERAENLMIVDLVRNDLSRIAKKNSVEVSDLFEIQSFETVHQMVSTVECRVENNTDIIEILKQCFPMGSMTGAPKIAAMKAIDAYENHKRGIYSGALGYIKPDGDFDFNVLIRTAVIEGNKLVYPVGGAITSDSDPKAEWLETLIKARAITNIFENAKNPE